MELTHEQQVTAAKVAFQEASALAARLKQELIEMTTVGYVAYMNLAGKGTIVALSTEFEPERAESHHSISFWQSHPHYVRVIIGDEHDECTEISIEDHTAQFLSKSLFWGYEYHCCVYKAANSREQLEQWLATSAQEELQKESKR